MRPSAAVLARLQRLHDTAFLTSATPDEALQWYQWAQALPASVTRGSFLSLTGFTLDGTHPVLESLMLAFNSEGAAFMLKIVKSRGEQEVEAAAALFDAPHVVPAQFAEASRHDGNLFCGLLMPKYERSLEASDLRLSPSVLFRRAIDTVEALNAIHERGWVHMDVKEANIFGAIITVWFLFLFTISIYALLSFAVDFAGQWWIGDFGSCVRHGAAIVSTTISCHPDGLRLLGAPARWEYDWYMLVVTILHQLDRSFSPDNGGSGAPFDAAVRHQCDAIAEPSLRILLINMLDCREPVFKLP